MIELTHREIQILLLKALTDVDAHCRLNNIPYYMIGGTLLGAIRHKGFIPWDDDIDIAMLRTDYDRFIESWKPEEHHGYVLQNTYTDHKCCHTITRVLITGTKVLHNGSYNITKEHDEMFLDIFPLDNVPDSCEERKRQRNELIKIKRTLGHKFSRTRSSGIVKQLLKKLRRICLTTISYHSLISKLNAVAQRYNACDTLCVCSMSSQYDYDKQTMDRTIYGKPSRIEFEDKLFLAPAQSERYLTHLYGDYMKLPSKEKQVFSVRVLAEERIRSMFQ